MGMFDYIICDAHLPDGFDSKGFEFQTKDTDEQYMVNYTITAEGRLIDHDGTDTNFHGDVEFYGSTMSACGPGYYTTQDDKPLVERGYTARFTNGQLQEIKLDATEDGGPDWKHAREHITRAEWLQRARSNA